MQQKNILFLGSNKTYLNPLIQNAAKLSNNFYITNTWKGGTLTNWSLFKNKLMLLRWLDTLYNFNPTLLDSLPSYIYIKLKNLHLKLNKQLKGIKHGINKPECIFIVNLDSNKTAFKEAVKSNLIIFTFWGKEPSSSLNSSNFISIPVNGNNYFSIKFILNIMTTALIHGSLVQENLNIY